MVNGEALTQVIFYNHFTLKELAMTMQLSPEQLKAKIKLGIFQSNELEMLLHILKFPVGVNPFEIFFDTYDADYHEVIEYTEEG